MDTEFWLQRWREGRTGWHHDAVMPLLQKHWPALGVAPGARVLVPLCGKTLDMLWLAEQGLHVLGVDLAPLAIESFLRENGLVAQRSDGPGGVRHRVAHGAGSIEIIVGDVFAVDVREFGRCDAVYDRAALIALPAPMREHYVRDVYGALPAGCRGLLITLDYPQHQMTGPPFAVGGPEVERLFGSHWRVEQAEQRDILAVQPSFAEQGVTALHTAVYRMRKSVA